MKRPLLQLIRYDREHQLPGDCRWTVGRSATGASTLAWLSSPWGKLNFWRPHRLGFWRWVWPELVVIDIPRQHREYAAMRNSAAQR